MIWIERNQEAALSAEGRLVYHYAMLNGLPTRFFSAQHSGVSLPLFDASDLVVGSVETVIQALRSVGASVPEPDYYPTCLRAYLGREVEKTVYEAAMERAQDSPLFMKSHEWKRLTGQVLRSTSTASRADNDVLGPQDPVWVSEVVHFRSEHRVYVLRDQVIATCQYGEHPDDDDLDHLKIREAVALMASQQPRQAYTFDWGVLEESGETVLIENNDAWAIGAYPGISPADYYHLLNTRWQEMISQSNQENQDGKSQN